MEMPSRRTNNFPESGRGLGHATPTIFGSTVGYPSDRLASCCFCEVDGSPLAVFVLKNETLTFLSHDTIRRAWYCQGKVVCPCVCLSIYPSVSFENYFTVMGCSLSADHSRRVKSPSPIHRLSERPKLNLEQLLFKRFTPILYTTVSYH